MTVITGLTQQHKRATNAMIYSLNNCITVRNYCQSLSVCLYLCFKHSLLFLFLSFLCSVSVGVSFAQTLSVVFFSLLLFFFCVLRFFFCIFAIFPFWLIFIIEATYLNCLQFQANKDRMAE